MVTLCYLTNRVDPKFQWFCDSLVNDAGEGLQKSQIIFIDLQLDYLGEERKQALADIVAGRFEYQHVPPKPTPWQGKHRQTKEDWFAASNARNTGFCLAKHDYVAFVDDLSILNPGYWSNLIHAAENKYLVLGMYKKLKKMVVENGKLLSCEEFAEGVDSRWAYGSPTGIIPYNPQGLFGCSFGVPLKAALQINGFDEGLDGQGWEDCHFGWRLKSTGTPCYLNRNLLTYESEEDHAQGPVMRRESIMTKLGIMSDWVVVHEVQRGENKTRNRYNLAEVREKVLAGESFPLPPDNFVDWRNGRPVSEW